MGVGKGLLAHEVARNHLGHGVLLCYKPPALQTGGGRRSLSGLVNVIVPNREANAAEKQDSAMDVDVNGTKTLVLDTRRLDDTVLSKK